jgi:hypothetical protein
MFKLETSSMLKLPMKGLGGKEQLHKVSNLGLANQKIMSNLCPVEKYLQTTQTLWTPNNFKCLDFKANAYLKRMTNLSATVLANQLQT